MLFERGDEFPRVVHQRSFEPRRLRSYILAVHAEPGTSPSRATERFGYEEIDTDHGVFSQVGDTSGEDQLLPRAHPALVALTSRMEVRRPQPLCEQGLVRETPRVDAEITIRCVGGSAITVLSPARRYTA
jgi:hypothetical protein